MVAVAVLCIGFAVLAAPIGYEIHAYVCMDFGPLVRGKVDNAAMFDRVNVEAPGRRFFSGSAVGHEVVGREYLQCFPDLFGVKYHQGILAKRQMEQAKRELFDEIEQLLERNHDIENYGYEVVLITRRLFGRTTTEILHDTLRMEEFGRAVEQWEP